MGGWGQHGRSSSSTGAHLWVPCVGGLCVAFSRPLNLTHFVPCLACDTTQRDRHTLRESNQRKVACLLAFPDADDASNHEGVVMWAAERHIQLMLPRSKVGVGARGCVGVRHGGRSGCSRPALPHTSLGRLSQRLLLAVSAGCSTRRAWRAPHSS
jgi:hypothetical protein